MKNSARPPRWPDVDRRPAAPAHYTPEARELWTDVCAGWDLDKPSLKVLGIACESLQRVREAQRILAREGLQVADRFGQKKIHPLVLVERDAASTLLTALKHLNLDLEPLRDRLGHPPGNGAY